MSDISVVIPSYNHAHFLKTAIESALTQTYRDIEIIVVDDGSTDNTAYVVEEFLGKIHYIWQENQGLSAARNTAIRNSQGEYIAFLDADDLWMPTFLEEQIANIRRNSKVGLTYSWWSYVDKNGKILPERGNYNKRGDLLMQLALMNYWPPVSVMVRKQCIIEAGCFDDKLTALEDWDLWLRIAANGWEIDYIPRVLVKYRRHDNNMTLDVERMERNQLAVLNKLEASPIATRIAHLIPHAQANVHLNSALSYHLQGKTDASYESFVKAIQIWPPILLQKETWYRWICADQPPGYQDTAYFKDLEISSKRVKKLQTQLYNDPDVKHLICNWKKKIEQLVGITLIEHYYLENETKVTRHLIFSILQKKPTILLKPRTTWFLLKSFLGKQRITCLRQLLQYINPFQLRT